MSSVPSDEAMAQLEPVLETSSLLNSSTQTTSTGVPPAVWRSNLDGIRHRVQTLSSSTHVAPSITPAHTSSSQASSSGSLMENQLSLGLNLSPVPEVHAAVHTCQLTLEELLQVHVTTPGLSQLNPFSLCPCCSVMVARHSRRGGNQSAVTAPSVPSSHSDSGERVQVQGAAAHTSKSGEGFLKLKKDLPIWKEGSRKTCYEFLREITELLSATEFSRNSWYRVLPLVVEEGFNRTWVHTNIVTTSSPPATWEDACAIFTGHFESADYLDRQWTKWHSLRFDHGESVQHFSDRFMVLLDELGLQPSDTIVKKHFLKCLPPAIRQRYDDFCLTQDLEADSEAGSHYEPDKVEIIIKICVRIDININMKSRGQVHSSSSHTYLSKRPDSFSGSSSNSSSSSSKRCHIHPHASHSWSECRLNSASNPGTVKREVSQTSGAKPYGSSQGSYTFRENKPHNTPYVKMDESVKCYKCGQSGHYASKCSTTTAKTNYNASPNVKVMHTSSQLQEQGDISNKVPPSVSGIDLLGKGVVWIQFKDQHRVRRYPCLLDTGSDLTVIDSTVADQLKLPRIPSSGSVNLAVMNVSAKREFRTTSIRFKAIFECDDTRFQSFDKEVEGGFEILRLPTPGCPIIIGKDLLPFLFEDSIPLCFLAPPPKSVSFHRKVFPSTAADAVNLALVRPVTTSTAEPESKDQDFDESLGLPFEETDSVDEKASAVFTDSVLEDEYAIHRERLMSDPEIVAALEENASITGFCTHPDSVLKLPIKSFVDGIIPKKLCRPQYRIPEKVRPKVREGIQRWYDEGKIIDAPPGTPYNNPIVVVPKKDSAGNVSYDEVRNCLDFRGTNEELEAGQMDQFQLPFIRDTMDKFVGCKIFGEFDLQEAFFQFKLHEESRPYTAFTFEGKQYMCSGVPFGLSIVPSHFQRVISKILHGLDFTQPYMDNIPFGSKDWETHKQQALAIIKRLTQYNLKIKPSSVKLGHSHMRCLGHLVSSQGIGIDPKKLSMIPDWPRPTSGKDLMSFLGFVTFIRDHIRHVADLTGPLEAVKNSKTLEWNDALEQCFVLTKKAVMSAPFLQYPDYSRPFHVATDASNTGVGGVLFQPKKEGEYITPYNIVAVCSKKLQSCQTRWSAYKKEYFGIVYCLRQFRPYIWGRDDLVVYTDHKPLTYVLSSTVLSTTVHGWFDELSDYNFKVIHRPGILNVLPDALSRMYSDTYKNSDFWGVNDHFNTTNITLVDPLGDDVPKDVKGATKLDQENTSSSQLTIPLEIGAIDRSYVNRGADHVGYGRADSWRENTPHANDLTNQESSFFQPSVSSLMGEESDNLSDEKKDQNPTHVNKYIQPSRELLLELENQGMKIPTNEEEQKELVNKEHAMGHFGITAIYRSLLSKNIWWPKMKQTIINIVQDCHDCLSFTVTKTGYNPSGFIHANGPWEHVQVDTSVHLPTSADGHTTLLVVIDVFTGFAILRACTSSTAEEIAKELWDIFCLFGFPKILQSDNGHEFVNDIMRVLIKLSGVEHRFISPYNPRADGKVERAIGTLVAVIKKMVHGSTTLWPMYVSFAQYAFNIKIATLTNSTPFALMFGRQPSEWKDYTQDPSVSVPYDYQTKLSKWKEHQDRMISVLLPAVNQRILSSKNQMIEHLNKTRKATMPKTLPMGTEVYLVDPVKTNKWQPKYLGPYTVVRRAHHGGYVLRDSTGDILDRHVTIDQLKIPSSKKNKSLAHPSEDEQNKDVEYAVEVIRDHRGDNPSNYEFLVKWVGYPETDNTWEPIANFRDKEVITKYFRSHLRSSPKVK